jgi:dihydroneopterin aldolase
VRLTPISDGFVTSSFDTITIKTRVEHCIVGVYADERTSPQPIDVSVTVYADLRSAARQSRLDLTVDYACLIGDLRFILGHGRFFLLETAGEAICRFLLRPNGKRPIAGVRVELSKPLAATAESSATVVLQRVPADFVYTHENSSFGEVLVISTHRECGIYELKVFPGRTITTHVHEVMHESEMALTDGLLLQGKPIAPGQAIRWPLNFPHRYDNPTDSVQSILCIDRPKFIPADEIQSPVTTLEMPPADCMSFYYPEEPMAVP